MAEAKRDPFPLHVLLAHACNHLSRGERGEEERVGEGERKRGWEKGGDGRRDEWTAPYM